MCNTLLLVPPRCTRRYVSTRATPTSDRVCSTLTRCPFPAQYTAVQPSEFADTVCKIVSGGCVSPLLQASDPVPTADRVCDVSTPTAPPPLYNAKMWRTVHFAACLRGPQPGTGCT